MSYDKFTTDIFNFDGFLVIEHTHPVTLFPALPAGGWYGASINVINKTTNGLITNIKVQADFDDDSRSWDAEFRDGGNNTIPAPTFLIDRLTPGQSKKLEYRMAPKRIGNEQGTNWKLTVNFFTNFNIEFRPSKDHSSTVCVDIRNVPAPKTNWWE